MRYYCPRFGRVVHTDADRLAPHPDCGWPWWAHPPVADGECGETAPCGDHGHPCVLALGHAGNHSTPWCEGAP